MGQQIKELEETINSTPVDLVLIGTPIDLSHVLKLKVPAIRVRYELLKLEALILQMFSAPLPPEKPITANRTQAKQHQESTL
jgi:hypothetical protein